MLGVLASRQKLHACFRQAPALDDDPWAAYFPSVLAERIVGYKIRKYELDPVRFRS